MINAHCLFSKPVVSLTLAKSCFSSLNEEQILSFKSKLYKKVLFCENFLMRLKVMYASDPGELGVSKYLKNSKIFQTPRITA